jgi:hypothetical protein
MKNVGAAHSRTLPFVKSTATAPTGYNVHR